MTGQAQLNADADKPRPDRTRRFTPKVKTGCYNCRRRRIKCPEQRPTCKRCDIAYLDCQYPFDKSKHRPTRLAPQPSTAASIFPQGVVASSDNLQLFTLFCSSTVAMIGGPFNQSFWRSDVPRAAIAYPAVWHASTALAAIYLSVKMELAKAQAANANADAYAYAHVARSKPYDSRNYWYLLALEHFNKSIRQLSQDLMITTQSQQDCGSQLSYANKEMAIMTNILYIAIGSVLDDEEQMYSHQRNLLRLLESFRFGDDYSPSSSPSPSSSSSSRAAGGIMPYDALLSVVLTLDGTSTKTPDVEWRWVRSWAVKVPSYDRFTSTTEAYIAMLPLVFESLEYHEGWALQRTRPTKLIRRRRYLERFERTFERFAASRLSKYEEECVDIIAQHLEIVKIKEAEAAATSRDDIIRLEKRLAPAVQHLGRMISQPGAQSRLYAPGQPFVFSLSFGSLLEGILQCAHSRNIRRKVVDMIRRSPYREGGARSHESIGFYQGLYEHEDKGPARTRALKLKLETAGDDDDDEDGLLDRVLQCIDECDCLDGQYVCYNHQAIDYSMTAAPEARYFEFVNRFEQKNKLPFTRYYC